MYRHRLRFYQILFGLFADRLYTNRLAEFRILFLAAAANLGKHN